MYYKGDMHVGTVPNQGTFLVPSAFDGKSTEERHWSLQMFRPEPGHRYAELEIDGGHDKHLVIVGEYEKGMFIVLPHENVGFEGSYRLQDTNYHRNKLDWSLPGSVAVVIAEGLKAFSKSVGWDYHPRWAAYERHVKRCEESERQLKKVLESFRKA